jgi:ribosomal protein S19E (S16A)
MVQLQNLYTKVHREAGTAAYQSRLRGLAAALRDLLDLSEADFSAKSGAHRQRMPDDPSWPWLRAASILVRCMYRSRSIKRLKICYGGLKRRGVKPSKRRTAGGAYLRRIVQSLQRAMLLTEAKGEGRHTTHQGNNLLARFML